MAINYCTIGRVSVDGFCGNQRAKVLARLIREAGHDVIVPPKPTPRPSGGATTIGNGFVFRPPVQPPMQPFRRPEIDQQLPAVEQPYITVTADIMGMTGSETIESSARLDFVIVTDLEINASPAISVNITEMEI